ncbi:MAG: Uma2 family endonuclease [Bryobacteraceae bacterium]|nr:Uma2 family endonuclease [Bryobacteraceae bacterium]
MTEEEYLAFERQSDFKHEYIEGLILDMSGVREVHSLLETQLAFLFRAKAPKCRIYSLNLRVGVAGEAIYVYPDLSVTCANPTFRDAEFDTLTNPTVIVEILSPSTENDDRGVKFEHYRSIESLRHYVVVHPDHAFVEHWSLGPDHRWVLDELRGGEALLNLTAVEA